MTDREAIVKCILENPTDTLPLMVLADYLDEQGKHDEAESVRKSTSAARGLWVHSGIEPLRGHTVLSAKFDDSVLAIQTEEGSMAFSVEGDCCSNSWWHRFDGVKNLIGATVLGFFEADTSDIDENDGRGRQESESIYSIGIITDKGTARLVFRNSSNGYYGGWIELTKDAELIGGTPLTTDWISPLPKTEAA